MVGDYIGTPRVVLLLLFQPYHNLLYLWPVCSINHKLLFMVMTLFFIGILLLILSNY